MSARFVFTASAGYLVVTVAEIAAALVSLPIMTRMLTPAEYGLMLLIANTAALINLVFGFSFAQALPTLFAGTAEPERRRVIATTVMVAIGVLSAILYGVLALNADRVAAYFQQPSGQARIIALGALASFLMAFSLCLASVVRLLEWHRLFLLTQLPAVAVQLVMLISLLLFAGQRLDALYTAMAAAGAFTTIVYLVALRRWLTGRFDRETLGEAAQIGARMLPWQMATLLATNTAGFFLVRSGHIEQAGVFAVAASLVAVLVSLSNSFNSAWTPFVLLRHAEPQTQITQRRVFEIYSVGLMLAASGLGLFAQELLTVLVGPAFRDAYHYVPPLAFASCLFCFANGFSQGLQAKQQTSGYTWIGVASALAFLAVCLPWVGRTGAPAIIGAMAAAFMTMLVLLQRESERLMPVGYPWRRHALMWLAAICIVALTYARGGLWQGLALKAAAALAIAALPFLFYALRLADLRLAVAEIMKLRP